MTNGSKNLNRGGGAAGGSGGERRDLRCQVPNRSSRRYRDAPERCSPCRTSRPPVQTNQPPPAPPPPTHARGTRRGRGGGAWSTYAAPPPPQAGNGGSIQVRGGCGRGFRAFWFSVSIDLWAGTLVHLIQFLAGKLIN